MKVAVLGAGINGLTCAVRVKEKYPNIDVVVISENFSPNTTGDGSGGMWTLYLCGSTDKNKLRKWGIETYKLLHKLWHEGGHSVTMTPLYELYTEETNLTAECWSNDLFGFRMLDKKHLDYLSELHSDKYVAGVTFTTFAVCPTTMLAHLSQRFKVANGRLMKGTVKSLNDPELKEYDVIINCLGLGARKVVPDDTVYPVRGQILGAVAPWVTETIINMNTGNYIIPNTINCVLGGTDQKNDCNINVNSEDTDFIANGCSKIIPGLKHAKVFKNWVGLRPCSEKIRIEPEEKYGKLYIHNYGHVIMLTESRDVGGSGFTIFWGCASNVLEIFDKHIISGRMKEKSKL